MLELVMAVGFAAVVYAILRRSSKDDPANSRDLIVATQLRERERGRVEGALPSWTLNLNALPARLKAPNAG